jgi:lysyl-tRNA synthetase, class II
VTSSLSALGADRGKAETEVGDERRAKLEQLRDDGQDPFPRRFPDRSSIAAVLDRDARGPRSQGAHRIAGRIIARRRHRQVVFLDVADRSGVIELVARRDTLDEQSFAQLAKLDLGDLIGADGTMTRPVGGAAIMSITGWVLLAKSLRPLPDKHHGLKDVESRFRRRELDLLSSSQARELVILRSGVVAAIRGWLADRGFLEVETPVLQPLYGGALARPFVTHHEALDTDLYLRIASELYLKRCVVGGLDDVYSLGKCFRNEGLSSEHNPEFTLLEWYRVGADYHDAAEVTEHLIADAATRAIGTTRIQCKGETIDLAPPWRRVSLREAVGEATGLDIVLADDVALADRLGAGATWTGRTDAVSRLFGRYVQPMLVRPTFVFDLPIELWPIARRHPSEPGLAEAWEAFVGGMELACGATDLNDPDEQRRRFVEQQSMRVGSDLPHPHDEDFVRALEHGMMPVGGSGIGIDRLVMLLAERKSLREVITFPTLRGRHEH